MLLAECITVEVWPSCWRSHLVGHNDRTSKLVSKPLQATEEAPEMYLAGGKLSTAIELCAVEGSDAVHNDESKSGIRHHRCCCLEQLCLMICVVRSGISHIVQDIICIEPIPAWQS